MKSNSTYLNKFLFRFNARWFFATLLIFLSLACWLLVPFIHGVISFKIIAAISLIILLLPTLPFLSTSFRNSRKRLLVNQLNETVDNLNYSSRLFFKDEASLNSLEKLQLKQSISFINERATSIQLRSNLVAVTSFFLLNLLAAFFIAKYQPSSQNNNENIKSYHTEEKLPIVTTDEVDSLKLLKFSIYIEPPVYTNIENYSQKKLSISAPEGSSISWKYKFNQKTSPLNLKLINKNLLFNTKDNITYTLSLKPKNNSVYSVQSNDSIKAPSLNSIGEIKLIKDQAPIIKIIDTEAYKELDINSINTFNLSYTLFDDYSITKAEAHLILSSGKGESVKFVEDYIPLSGLNNNTSYQKNIDLKKYEAQPGDEFYIRIKASDNKPVKPNLSYSSTCIIAIKDTAKVTSTFEMALGMDVEPEYFRSQRQLIIDTEKLLKKQSELSAIAFKEQSNNIGIEQKLLRLRYGKFLGEEFEGEIGIRKDEEKRVNKKELLEAQNIDPEKEHLHGHDEEHDHNDHTDHHHHHHNEEESKHLHSEDCEHHHDEETRQQYHTENEKDNESDVQHQHDGHNHSHTHNHDHSNTNDNENPEQVENLLAPFIHFHDSGEMNTFFESKVKTKLKAALAEMWQSELQLRVGKPKLSLPYQNKALKLIKEVQQASRIYVERVGLELPKIPVAKKRLTGELDDVENVERKKSYVKLNGYEALKQTITKFNELDTDELNLRSNVELINNLTQQLYPVSERNSIASAKALHLTQKLKSNSKNVRHNYLKLKQHLNDLVLEIEGEKGGKKTTENTRLNNLFKQYLHD